MIFSKMHHDLGVATMCSQQIEQVPCVLSVELHQLSSGTVLNPPTPHPRKKKKKKKISNSPHVCKSFQNQSETTESVRSEGGFQRLFLNKTRNIEALAMSYRKLHYIHHKSMYSQLQNSLDSNETSDYSFVHNYISKQHYYTHML